MKRNSGGGGGLFGFFRNAFGATESATESGSLDTVGQADNASNAVRFREISAILKTDVLNNRKRIQNIW